MTLVRKAIRFAIQSHGNQKRKYTGEPYFSHLEEVASYVEAAGFSSEVVAAAYLHDTLEDTEVTIPQLHAYFGFRVMNLVHQVTDVSRPNDGNRKFRKARDRAHLAEADPSGASIKLADLISNTRSIVAHDPKFARVYLQEANELLQVLSLDASYPLRYWAEKLVGHNQRKLMQGEIWWTKLLTR